MSDVPSSGVSSHVVNSLFPPMNYAAVEDGLHRSALPMELNYGFIRSLNIKTFVIMSPESVREDFVSFLDDCSINAVFIESKISEMSQYAPIAEDSVISALDILLNQSYYPVYVACNFGKLLTGVVIACLRKLQKWSLVSIYEEFRRFTNSRLLEHEQFIELFDTDLVTVTLQSPPFLRNLHFSATDTTSSYQGRTDLP